MRTMFKNWKSVIKFKEVFLYVGILVLLLVMSWQTWNNNELGRFWLIAIIEIVLVFGIFLVLRKMERRKVPMEKRFLFAGILFGVLFILVLPPGQSPDDINHFRRAYGITEGQVVASEMIEDFGGIGSKLPTEIESFEQMPSDGAYERVGDALIKGNSGEETEQVYTNTALYNFICYLPQTLAGLIGKMFGMSVMGIAYLMEIFNFAMWVLMVYFAIKIIPRFKRVVLYISLLPITLQEATSLAPDAMTIGLGLLLISYVLHLAYGYKKVKMERYELVLLYMIAAIIGFCKIVYYPLILLYLVIPAERFGGKKQKWIHLGVIGLVTLALNLIWLGISSNLLIEFNPGVNSKEQLIGIFTNPVKYGMTIFRTINSHWQVWLSNMFGLSIGSFSFNLPGMLFASSFIIFILLFIQRDESLPFRKYDRLIYVMTFSIIILLIFTSLYIQWTAVGAGEIDGVQGRYYLPILLLIPLMVCNTNKNKKNTTMVSERGVLCYGVLVNMIAVITILAQNI